MYWDKENETLKKEKLVKLQEERLKKIVRYCYENVAFYKSSKRLR